MTTALKAMTDGDIYGFHYNQATMAKMFEPNHCFDGQLIYRDGMLTDTYWGFDPRGDSGRRFTPAEAEAKGTLTFVCNLNETEPISEHLFPQYDEADRFNLSHQHGCYKKFAIRKGATKNLTNRLVMLAEREKEAKRNAEYAMRRAFDCLERCAEQRKRLEAGEDVSI